MPDKQLNRFFISIVFPSIMAVALYVISIFAVILPAFEKNSMEGKKEMISELTNTAWSLLDEYYQEVRMNNFPEDSAKKLAAERIREIRYGSDYKDYFWIIDETPVMVMHPYLPGLNGTSLDNYKDPDGKLLFVEAVEVVHQNGEGFIDYKWQWKDDPDRIVPKLSYVKGFQPWEWIIGTGIYLEDVRQEIGALKQRLLRIALIITLIISIILGFVIRQSLRIERKRTSAERKLKLSRQKYKALVDASTEGTLMLLDHKIIYANIKFSHLSGYDPAEIREVSFDHLFRVGWEKLMEAIDDPGRTYSAETILHCRDGSQKEVVISVSLVSYAEQEGKIIVVKELSPRQQMKRNSDQLSSELQSSLLLMQQPIGPRVKALRKCSASTTIREAAEIMARKDVDIIFVTQEDRIIGVVTDSDLRRRVVASSAEPGMPVMEIMTSPVISIGGHALIYEAIILMKEQGISHLAVKNSKHEITGVISHADLADLQHNVISVLLAEINAAEETDQLASLYDRLPVLVKTLLESGDRLDHLTRIISSVNDAIHQRVIALAIEEASTPPCRFAFLVMGSEGRKEQTLATDQDNAIVFDDLPVEQEKAVQEYFRNLGGRINEMLHTIGYQYCKGEVMARNPRWTQSLSTWKKYFTDWIQTGNPHDILEASIFFDFRNVYGDGQLVTELREHVNSVAKNRAVFFYHMAQAVLKFKSPMNLFGKIVGNTTNDDALNLDMKKSLFPVIAFLRLYAIREQLSETNSMDRAVRLLEKQVIEQSLYEDLQQAYHFMSALRLRSQVRDIIENNPPGNMVDLHQLSRIEVNTLKQVLSGISELQTKVSFDFKGAE